ncbi:MAG TPA: metallophosphoesterase [Candidatus Omnitrophica bacterium]|nr:MAG: hypothetical protein A2Z81_10030 [Omnitrophica WOR_2 bacterium GWA2_45_18]HBR15370.1 metallophosphoesterase [Candidatus Omnitrophota bacterium]
MRYAVLSDIHGNLEALQAVIQACRQQRVEAFLCVGDTVGYGANPQECLEILRGLKAISVAGNHDWAVSGKLDFSYFTEDGQAAVLWTRNKIAFEQFNYLNSLELVYKNEDVILAHGSLDQPAQFNYLEDLPQAQEAFPLMDRGICFVGHTHVPRIFIQRGEKSYFTQILEMELSADDKYIVNVGSVGQPRDGNSLASYGIYDTGMAMIDIKRVPYDIPTAQRKILEAGLPEHLAERLALGR